MADFFFHDRMNCFQFFLCHTAKRRSFFLFAAEDCHFSRPTHQPPFLQMKNFPFISLKYPSSPAQQDTAKCIFRGSIASYSQNTPICRIFHPFSAICSKWLQIPCNHKMQTLRSPFPFPHKISSFPRCHQKCRRKPISGFPRHCFQQF